MARYMLDTDTCSYIMKRSSQAVLDRLQAVPVTDVCISIVTKSANDLFIAAHARSLGLALVTNNTAEFGRVKGLTLENWTLRRRSRSTSDR